MWTQYLKNNGFAALYFNAWKCDFVDDPLLALLGELKKLHADDSNYKKIASVGVFSNAKELIGVLQGAVEK